MRWLQHLAMCGGMLPTDHLFQLTRDTHVSRDITVRALKRLFEAGWLNRDKDQEDAVRNNPDTRMYNWRFNKLVHTLSPQAIELLQHEGLWNSYYPNPKALNAWYPHQIFCNSIRSSLFLEAHTHDVPIWMEHTLLERVQGRLRFKVKGYEDELIPDGLAAVEIDGKRFLLFIECDRGTEPLRSKSTGRKTWQTTLALYKSLFDNDPSQIFDFAAHPLLLNITTSIGRAETMNQMAFRNVLTTYIPEFHPQRFKPTNHYPLLTTDWKRPDGSTFRFIRTP